MKAKTFSDHDFILLKADFRKRTQRLEQYCLCKKKTIVTLILLQIFIINLIFEKKKNA